MIKICISCPICGTTQHMDSKITFLGIDISRLMKYTGEIIRNED